MMAEYQHEAKNLPPGWDCKYDVNTGKCYYFNYLTKAMSLEDPRIRLRQMQQQQQQQQLQQQQHQSDPSVTHIENIQMQPMHGSPYHVYPTNNHQAVQAFQGPINTNTNTMHHPHPHPHHHNHHYQPHQHHQHQHQQHQLHGASPLLAAKYQQQLEMSPIALRQHSASPHMPRIMSQLARQPSQHQQHQQQQQQLGGFMPALPLQMASSLSHQQQETSFITAADTEAAVTKINTMFPTANDDHIRLLMKKYHNREAVVISALQVEKHPIATPGPFATPPPPGRHATLLAAAANAFGINASTSTVHSMTPLLGGGGGSGSGGGGGGGNGHGGSRSSSRFAGIVSETFLMGGGGGGGHSSSYSRTGSPGPVRPTSSCASVMTMGTTVLHHYPSSQGIVAAGSPRVGESYRSSPRPHSSPKMKLRYLKSIFPKADETLLLDTLANADNNVQHASEHLLTLGYEKRDTTAPKVTNRNREEQVKRDRQLAESTPPPQPKVCNNEEKQKIKAQLQAQYADIPGRIITMALESVDYSQDRACQILQIVMQDDKRPECTDKTDAGSCATKTNGSDESNELADGNSAIQRSSSSSSSQGSQIGESDETLDVVPQLLRKSKRVRPMVHSSSQPQMPEASTSATAQVGMVKSSTTIMPAKSAMAAADGAVADGAPKSEFQSTLDRIKADGPSAGRCRGPNEELLLADYISWNGANPEMRVGHKSLARGPNSALRSASVGRYSSSSSSSANGATGANSDLCKGAQSGLAKGSIYAQLGRQMANVKCN